MSGSGGVKIPVGASFDPGDLTAAIEKMVAQLNKMGNAVAAANKVKFEPITKASIEDVRRYTAQFEQLKKVQDQLRQRIRATGQTGADFASLDFTQLYPDPNVRARQSRRAFEYVVGSRFTPFPAPPAPVAPPAPAAPLRPPAFPQPMAPGAPPGGGSPWTPIWKQPLMVGLESAGPLGGVAAGGFRAAAGGLGAGLGGLAGGLLALGVSSLVGGVRQKLGQAENESINVDTLKRSLGDLDISFNGLRESLRAASDRIGVTFDEAGELGAQFARLSGLSRLQSKDLAEEVAISGGFGRSFGMDVSRSSAFFAQMRGVGLTSNPDDSRRLGLMIGEAVAKSGVFSKADEILTAVAGYGIGQARSSLSDANLSGYAGALAGMVSSRTPGLDVTGSANILDRVNSSIASGGSAGDAGQMFLYSALGRGLDPIQARVLQEGGAFGSGRSAFGPGSIYDTYAHKFGMEIPSAVGSTTSNFSGIKAKLMQLYQGKPALMADAFSRLTGLNISQAMAALSIEPAQMGGLESALGRAGVDLHSLSATGISSLAQISVGDRGTLLSQASSLQARTGKDALSADERQQLAASIRSGNTDDLRNTLIKISASRDQEETEGSKTRESIQGVDKTLQDLAGKLIPATNTMRDALVLLAGGGHGARYIAERVHGIEVDDVNDLAAEKSKAARSAYEAQRAKLMTDPKLAPANATGPGDEYRRQQEIDRQMAPYAAQRDAALADIEKERQAGLAALNASKTPDVGASTMPGGVPGAQSSSGNISNMDPAQRRAYALMAPGLSETDRQLGLTPGTSAAQIMQESSFRPLAPNSAGAMGYAQTIPSTLASIEKRLGRKLNPFDYRDAVILQREVMREDMAHYHGNQRLALMGYEGGFDQSNWGSATVAYPDQVMNRVGAFAPPMPLPAGHASASGPPSRQKIEISGHFTLNGQNGQPVAAPAAVRTVVSSPAPWGS